MDAYYAGSSSSLSIPHVRVPLLIIQAADDPIAPVAAIPFEAIQANPQCLLVVTPSGGHLGWCSGPTGVLGVQGSPACLPQPLACLPVSPGIVRLVSLAELLHRPCTLQAPPGPTPRSPNTLQQHASY